MGHIRVYLGFPFIGFMQLPFCPFIGIYIYIYINFLNNKISLSHNTLLIEVLILLHARLDLVIRLVIVGLTRIVLD